MLVLFIFLCCLCNKATSLIIDPYECTAAQSNSESCLYLPYYKGYQKAKCLSELEIETRSKKKVICKSKTKYCWYLECQMSIYQYGFNPVVHPNCRCEAHSINYCNHVVDHGKTRCLKLPDYNVPQYVTCLHTAQVLYNSYGTGCSFPQTHCWYSCQAEKHQQPSGEVSDDCKCNPSSSNLLTIPIKLLFGMFIISFFI